jgi:hypothetical protein
MTGLVQTIISQQVAAFEEAQSIQSNPIQSKERAMFQLRNSKEAAKLQSFSKERCKGNNNNTTDSNQTPDSTCTLT